MYRCKQCGRESPGQSESGVCLECAPPSVPPVTRDGGRVRCTNCGQDFASTSRSPQVECPHCGRMVYLSVQGPVAAMAAQSSSWRLDAALRGGEESTKREGFTVDQLEKVETFAKRAAMGERLAVVRWLRNGALQRVPGDDLQQRVCRALADLIEAGEHAR